MKLECRIKNLKDGVSKNQKVILKSSTTPILGSMFLKATGKSLLIRSTNLHIGVEVEIPANIEKEGEFIVSGEIFSQVLSSLSDEGVVNLWVDDQLLKVQTKKSVISINSSGETNEFPTLPVVEGKSFTIPVQIFLDGIRSVYYCASVSDIKPEISSVYVYARDNEIIFVSTDSFRLAEKKIPIEGFGDIDGVLIPYKNVLELVKLFSDSQENVFVSYNENQINFSIPGMFITSRIVNGSYPNYSMIIPKEFKTQVITLKQDMLNTLKLSTIFSDKFNQISVSVDSNSKSLVMKAKNTQKGENISQIDASIEGVSIEMNFNHRYFSESFQSISTDSTVLQFNEENKPVVIRGVGDKSFLYLIMPMNR